MSSPETPTFQLYCARLVAQQRREVRQLIGDAIKFAGGNLEVEGSGLRAFVEWMENHQNAEALRIIADGSLDDAVRLLNAMDDHAESIEILLRSERGHTTAAATLLRGLVEGTVQVCYLYDANVPPARTAARMVAQRIDAAQGNEKTLKEFGNEVTDEDRQTAREGTDGFKDFFIKSGFTLGTTKRPSRYTPSVSIDGEVAQVDVNMTDEMRRYMPDETFGWVVASGAVHSKAWFLPSYVGSIDEEPLSHPDHAVTVVVTSLLRASEALAKTVAEHTGFDATSVEKHTFRRVKAVIAGGTRSPFSPIDMATYRASGKSSPPRERGTVGPSFMKPGTTYGPL